MHAGQSICERTSRERPVEKMPADVPGKTCTCKHFVVAELAEGEVNGSSALVPHGQTILDSNDANSDPFQQLTRLVQKVVHANASKTSSSLTILQTRTWCFRANCGPNKICFTDMCLTVTDQARLRIPSSTVKSIPTESLLRHHFSLRQASGQINLRSAVRSTPPHTHCTRPLTAWRPWKRTSPDLDFLAPPEIAHPASAIRHSLCASYRVGQSIPTVGCAR